MSADKVIHEFKKNALEKVVCQFREFKRNKLVDIRVFYEAENEEWRPTTKGISLRLELIPELKQAIDKAAEEWEIQLPGKTQTVQKN